MIMIISLICFKTTICCPTTTMTMTRRLMGLTVIVGPFPRLNGEVTSRAVPGIISKAPAALRVVMGEEEEEEEGGWRGGMKKGARVMIASLTAG